VILNWITETPSADCTQHTSVCTDVVERDVQAAVDACAEYAFTLLDENITDNAMYCLFIWDSEKNALTIVVTDETKKLDGKHRVTMGFSAFPAIDGEEPADTVKYWITDYLTTCPSFLAFSLLAGFVRAERDRVELM